MQQTKVINFFAGSGAGKSTAAAALFAEMKQQGLDVELVREYVKDWAWTGRKIGPYDQLYIFGKQAHAEAKMYNILRYVVTDSPILLGPFYEEYHTGQIITRPSALAFLKYAEAHGVTYYNYFLERTKPFNPRGRYETEEQAREIDMALKQWLHNMNIPFETVSVSDRERTGYILSSLGLKPAFTAQGNKPGEE
jgi:hypothetical protein